jgi:hypothetical protein
MQINTFFVINDAFKFANVHMFVNFLFLFKRYSHSRVIGLAHSENIHTWKSLLLLVLYTFEIVSTQSLTQTRKFNFFSYLIAHTASLCQKQAYVDTASRKFWERYGLIVHLTRGLKKRTICITFQIVIIT